MGTGFPTTERGLLNNLASQTRVQEVKDVDQLNAAITSALYRGPIPNDGVGALAVTGACIVIVENIRLRRTIVLPRRAIGITITAAARFPIFVEHTGPVFRVEGQNQTIDGLYLTVPTLGDTGPSLVAQLSNGGYGDPSYFTLKNCIALAQEFVATDAGVTCERATISRNDFVRSSGSSTAGITISGNGVLVEGNSCGSQCDVLFTAASTGTRCYGNDIDGGSVTNAASVTGANI